MNKKQQHPYAEILRAIADGEEVQVRTDKGWVRYELHLASEFRIKPRTIKIGEYEVPEPLRSIPVNSEYYYVCLSRMYGKDFYSEGCLTTKNRLENGIVHPDKESAIAHAKALISLSQNK